MFRILIIFLCFLLLVVSSYAQDLEKEKIRDAEWQMKSLHWQKMQDRLQTGDIVDQSDFDVKYWELDIDVTDIDGEIVAGKVTMTSESMVNSLTSIDYDFHSQMSVDSVFMYGQSVGWSHGSNILNITLDQPYDVGEEFTTVVYYHGHPPGGGFGSFTWETHNGQPIVSTLSEPEGAREWWPCKDMPHDKADSADVLITISDDLVGTSNGSLVSNIDNGDGTRTFHWHSSYPITTYLISLAISNYQPFTDWYHYTRQDSMPIVNYVYPEHYDDAVEDLNITAEAIGVYADMFGEYPFINEKYGHSIFPWGGAMEHQCNTSYGDILIHGNHYYDWILVHELAHQWFGDLISCDIWPEIWMNEGFASYCEALWFEYLGGLEDYLDYMTDDQYVYDPSGPIYDPDPLFDGNTVYNKGAWALHMLRGVMGDEAFFEGMYNYANDPDHVYGTITTREFQAIMEQSYGDSLGWYFDQWIWGMNRPQYRYSWIKEDIGGGQYEIFLHIRQIQGSPAPDVFTMPIKIYPRINGVDTLITVFNDSREDDFRFIVDGYPSSLAFDKHDWILRYVQSENYSLNIVTTELPDGYVNTDYNALVESRGGAEPYGFAVHSGEFPPGLNLALDGEITGHPSSTGDFEFTIRCTDDNNSTDDQLYNVTILEIPLCCDVDMTPDDDPVIVEPGGRFGLTGYIGNHTSESIITDVWGGVLYQGDFYQQFSFPNIPLDPGESITAHTWQNVPGFAPAGSYGYIAYCGDRPDTKCDSAEFPFTVAGARLADGATGWTIEGSFFGYEAIAADIEISDAYPNPFNAITTISYQLPVAAKVRLDIYNLMGQTVATLINRFNEAGYHTVNWDASGYSSGVYFYKLEVGDKVFTRRMTLLK